MNQMLRLLAITSLVLLGFVTAWSQESKATQAVNFAVRRSDAPIALDGIKHKTMAHEVAPMKVTVLFDVSERISKSLSPRTTIPHVDANVLRTEELESAFHKKSFLVTITD